MSDKEKIPTSNQDGVSGLLRLNYQDRIALGRQIKAFRYFKEIDSVNQLECMLDQIGMLVVKKQ
jgi:hypothetical protein